MTRNGGVRQTVEICAYSRNCVCEQSKKGRKRTSQKHRKELCLHKQAQKKASTKEESHEKEGKKKMAKRPAKEEVVKFVVGLYTKF